MVLFIVFYDLKKRSSLDFLFQTYRGSKSGSGLVNKISLPTLLELQKIVSQ